MSETGNSNGYLIFFYGFAFIFSLISQSDLSLDSFNLVMTLMGGLVGILNVSLMLLTSQSLNRGRAGLTFAFQNASAVFPGVLLFISFGKDYGFSVTYTQIIGIAFVLLGFDLRSQKKSERSKKHLKKLVILCFGLFSSTSCCPYLYSRALSII